MNKHKRETVKAPRRLKILPFMSIDGVREGKRLQAGLYELGKNMSEEEAIRLASPEFSHCVRLLPDRPQQEALATDVELPEPSPGYKYAKEKQHQAEIERWERDHGKHTHKPEDPEDSE